MLVFGASGAVGTAAVQLARHLGAEVTGVCSAANVERYDLIFDAVGKDKSANALRRCRRVLAPGGTCISVDDGTPKLRRQDLLLLGELAASGEIKPVIDRVYSLDDIVAAHSYVDLGHKRGNVILSVA